jgi:hypothetical protein
MFVFAIETCGKTVALIQEDNRLMLDGFLTGEREEGMILRRDIMESFWDGSSPFTARLATPAEELDYSLMYYEAHGESHGGPSGESVWYFYGDFVAAYCRTARDSLKSKAA